MELIPYVTPELATPPFLDEMQFVRLNPIYQARALSVENLIKEAISWHNTYVNQIYSFIPSEHEWNNTYSDLFRQLSWYYSAAGGVFLEHVQARDWYLHGINHILPLVYSKAEELIILDQKQRFLWDLFMQGGRINPKYEHVFNNLTLLRQQMEDHTRLCQRMLNTLSSYYHSPNLWANPIDLNSAPPGEE
jgi:hypothetical protein